MIDLKLSGKAFKKVLDIECGLKHSLVRVQYIENHALQEEVFGFGDNSHGQIQHDIHNNNFVVAKPKEIASLSKFKGMVQKIHAGDKISLFTYENEFYCETKSDTSKKVVEKAR